jgi:hypothetical protein
MSKKNKDTFKSNCCNAVVKYKRNDKKETTDVFSITCTKCDNPCNVHVDERRTWAINPKTRIVPNKKKDRKLSNKELNKFREEEDF